VAILVLITAILIPKFLAGVKGATRETTFKETYQTISTVFGQGVAMGEVSSYQETKDYLKTHMHYANWDNTCFTFQNEATLCFGSWDRVTLDYNGPHKGPNNSNLGVGDRIMFSPNYGFVVMDNGGGVMARPGEFLPYNQYNNRPSQLFNALWE